MKTQSPTSSGESGECWEFGYAALQQFLSHYPMRVISNEIPRGCEGSSCYRLSPRALALYDATYKIQ